MCARSGAVAVPVAPPAAPSLGRAASSTGHAKLPVSNLSALRIKTLASGHYRPLHSSDQSGF
jgi:hypothetical protein